MNKKACYMEKLRKFEAQRLLNNDLFSVIEISDPTKEEDWIIRFSIDKERGTLSITGNMGYAIADWYGPMDEEGVFNRLYDIGYFVSKIKSASDLYTYNESDIKEDLQLLKTQLLKDGGEFYELYSEDEINADIEELERLFLSSEHPEFYNSAITDIFDKYTFTWQRDHIFCDIGRRIDSRVYIWCFAYREAFKQLSEASWHHAL